MEMLIDKILSNLNNSADLGRQKAFELGNPLLETQILIN